MTRLQAVLLVASLLAGGCTGSDRPAVAPSPTRPAGPDPRPPVSPVLPTSPAAGISEVPCRETIANRPPDPGLEVVLGVVALPTRTLLQAHPSEPGWLFAKQGIVVRADAAVDVSVPSESGQRIRIGWGNSGRRVTQVRFPSCPTGSGWLAYAGGYQVVAPACVPLTVRYAGREAQARISVGVRCPSG